MTLVEKRLDELGIVLPEAAAPAANYVPYVVAGEQIVISGQVPFENGKLDGNIGKVGADIDTEQATRIAKVCAINVIAQAKAANGGDLDTLRCVRLGVFVNATPDFTEHSVVANGASDLMVEVFGDNGKHARAAVGAGSLPFGVAVEVDAVFAR